MIQWSVLSDECAYLYSGRQDWWGMNLASVDSVQQTTFLVVVENSDVVASVHQQRVVILNLESRNLK